MFVKGYCNRYKWFDVVLSDGFRAFLFLFHSTKYFRILVSVSLTYFPEKNVNGIENWLKIVCHK